VRHLGGRRGVDERAVLRDPVGVLGGGHDEHGLDAVEGRADHGAVVVGRTDGAGSGELGRGSDSGPAGAAAPGVGEAASDPAAELHGRAGDAISLPTAVSSIRLIGRDRSNPSV